MHVGFYEIGEAEKLCISVDTDGLCLPNGKLFVL